MFNRFRHDGDLTINKWDSTRSHLVQKTWGRSQVYPHSPVFDEMSTCWMVNSQFSSSKNLVLTLESTFDMVEFLIFLTSMQRCFHTKRVACLPIVGFSGKIAKTAFQTLPCVNLFVEFGIFSQCGEQRYGPEMPMMFMLNLRWSTSVLTQTRVHTMWGPQDSQVGL